MALKRLRIKIDDGLKLQWMLCDLSSVVTIADLRKKVKARTGLKKFELLLDDAILPKEESIEILKDGDKVTIKNFSAKSSKETKIKKVEPTFSEEDCTESSSSSSSEEEPLEQPFKTSTKKAETTKSCLPSTNGTKNKKKESESSASEGEEEQPKKKRKRRRKNKNKNKLPDAEIVPEKQAQNAHAEPVVPKVLRLNVPSQAKHKLFPSDDEEADENRKKIVNKDLNGKTDACNIVEKVASSPQKKKKLTASSTPLSCEDLLLNSSDHDSSKAASLSNGKANNLSALLKLAEKPITVKAKKQAQKDIYSSKSVVLTNTSHLQFDLNKLETFETFSKSDSPSIGQIFAFKCLQIGPDYTPQVVQFVGELKEFSTESNQAKFLVLYDENSGKERSDKFEVDEVIDKLILKNQEVEFNWGILDDLRLVPSSATKET